MILEAKQAYHECLVGQSWATWHSKRKPYVRRLNTTQHLRILRPHYVNVSCQCSTKTYRVQKQQLLAAQKLHCIGGTKGGGERGGLRIWLATMLALSEASVPAIIMEKNASVGPTSSARIAMSPKVGQHPWAAEARPDRGRPRPVVCEGRILASPLCARAGARGDEEAGHLTRDHKYVVRVVQKLNWEAAGWAFTPFGGPPPGSWSWWAYLVVHRCQALGVVTRRCRQVGGWGPAVLVESLNDDDLPCIC